MAKRLDESKQLNLVLHTAVDYTHRRGAGIGVVQRVECASTGTHRNDRMPGQERKYSYSREQLVTNNIKTEIRAHMLACVHAMGMARRTVRDNPVLRNVIIYSPPSPAIQTINFYIQSPDSVENIVSTNDRSIVRNVVTRIRELSRHDIQVTIAAIPGKDEAIKDATSMGERDKANKRSKKMARQGGRKAWERRRRPTDGHPAQDSPHDEAHRAESSLDLSNSRTSERTA